MYIHSVSSSPLGLNALEKIISGDVRLEMSREALDRITSCRKYLDNKMRIPEN